MNNPRFDSCCFKNSVLENRYSTFDKFRDTSPFFDEGLNAHIVLRFDDCLSLLKSTVLSSNRKQQQFDEIKTSPSAAPIINFYNKWLMYMEGDLHKEQRKFVMDALKKSMHSIDDIIDNQFNRLIGCLREPREELDLIANFSSPLTLEILSSLFGVSPVSYAKLIEISKPIVAFLGDPSLGDEASRAKLVQSLHDTYQLIHLCIEACDAPDSFIGHLQLSQLDQDNLITLLINVLIDGYDPLLSIINAYFLKASQGVLPKQRISSDQLFDELCRLETPFQYCGRIAISDFTIGSYAVKKGERMMLMIGAANRDSSYFDEPNLIKARKIRYKHLSFGMGLHACPGINISRKVVVRLMYLFQMSLGNICFQYQKESWMSSFGFRQMTSLYVKLAKCEPFATENYDLLQKEIR